MNTSLTRKEHLNRTLEPADFAGIAGMLADWRRVCESGVKGKPEQAVTLDIRLWGFPKPSGETLREQAAARFARRDLPDLSVTLLNPDTLSLQSKPLPFFFSDRNRAPVTVPFGDPGETLTFSLDDFATAPVAAAGSSPNTAATATVLPSSDGYNDLAALIGAVVGDEAFAGLLCEVRLTLSNAGSAVGKSGSGGHTVVFSGILQNGGFRLRAIWPAGEGEFSETAYSHAPWPHEKTLLSAYEKFVNGQLPAPLPEWVSLQLFRNASGKRVASFLSWFLYSSDKGVQQFALRLAAAIGFAIFSAALSQAIPALKIWFHSGALLGVFGFVYAVQRKVKSIIRSHHSMYKLTRTIYSHSIKYPSVDLSKFTGALDDPSLKKYTAEIVALGGVHFRDVTCDPPLPRGSGHIRLFLFPDNLKFALLLLYQVDESRVAPTKAIFSLETRFTDGFRLSSAPKESAWSKKLLPHDISRTFDDVTDPEVMLQKHRATVQEMEAAGHVRETLVPEEVIPNMEATHDELCAAKAKYGYFRWSDAVHMAFGIPRREYRE